MDKLKNNKSGKKGFLTIELMISLALMALTLSAIVLVSFSNQNFLIDSQTNSEALKIAQKLLENAQAEARKDFRMVNPKLKPTTPNEDNYYTTWTDVTSSSNPNDYFTKLVTSHVEWTDGSKITRNVQLSTLVTNFENAIGGDTCNSFLTGNWISPQKTDRLFGTIVGDTNGLYPITDLDIYNNKAYVSVSSVGTDPTSVSAIATTASDTTISGGVTWSNPNNSLTSNGSNATSSNTLNNTKVTNYLKITGFNFAIPSWATITGIKIEVKKSRGSSGSGSILDSQIKIVRNNVIGGSANINKADTSTSWPSSNTYVQAGASDVWGETWSPADINSSTFGVAISATGSSGGSRTAQVDNVQITITYTRQFYVLNTSTPTNPVFVNALGSNNITSGINAVAVDGKYAYLATNSSSVGQLEIVDLTITPPSVVSILKLGTAGTSVGNSIFYKNGYVYLGLTHTASGPAEFNIIDVHNPLAPTLSGSLALGYVANSIYVRNNYAYVAHPTDSSATNQEQITVIDISNPTSPQRLSGYHAPDNQGDGKSIFTVGDNLYLGRVFTSTANNEFYILNNSTPANLSTNNPNSPQPQGQKISSSVNGLMVRDYLAFILQGTGTKFGQLQILNITNPVSITPYTSTISLPNTSAGVSTETIDCEGNYLYIGSVPNSGTFLNKGSISIITAL